MTGRHISIVIYLQLSSKLGFSLVWICHYRRGVVHHGCGIRHKFKFSIKLHVGWTGIAVLPDTITYVALLGFANALVWPAVWPLALDGLGKLTPKGSALLIMGIAGGALLPLVYGELAEHFDHQSAYWMMLPCYLFILYYAVKGHKMRQW